MFENLRCTNKILAQQLDALLKVNANQAEQLNAQTELLKQQADELARQSELLAKQSAQIKALLQKIDELTGGPMDLFSSKCATSFYNARFFSASVIRCLLLSD